MMTDTQLVKIKEIVGERNNQMFRFKLNKDISLFESENNLSVPQDLAQFFLLLENSIRELDKDLYQFYRFSQFKSLNYELVHWAGIPDYRNIVTTLEQYERCYVFADYMSHLFVYAIRLSQNSSDINQVYLICGDQYKVLANSFSEFLELYLNDSIELKTI